MTVPGRTPGETAAAAVDSVVPLQSDLAGLPARVLLGGSEPVETVASIATSLFVLLVGMAVLILAKSVVERRADRRRRALEDRVRDELYERLRTPDPAWEPWVNSLSDAERRVLVDRVERTLDLVSGSDEAALADLARTLSLEASARDAIESGSRHERLRGLKRLVAFGWSADPKWLNECISDDRAEREAAIRVAATDANPVSRRLGVALALSETPLSVYGMDALYELVRDDPEPLLRRLNRRPVENPDLLAQALLVVSHSRTVTDDAPIEWVLECLDHDDPDVRANACRVLADYGWRASVRDKVDVNVTSLFEDPSVTVRIRAYEMLGSWGDAAARAKLARAAESESNSRARFAIARGLRGEVDRYIDADSDASLEDGLRTWAAASEIGRSRLSAVI